MNSDKKIFLTKDGKPGLVGSTLLRPTYNDEELKKAVDVVVDELLPEPPVVDRNLVPLEDYNAALSLIEELSFNNETLTIANDNFTSLLAELDSDRQSLQSEIDALNATIALLENQIAQAQNSVKDLVDELTSVRQQLTTSQIENAELSAKLAALEAQIAALRAQITALQAALSAAQAAGAGGGGGAPPPPSPPQQPPKPNVNPNITLNKTSETVTPSVGVRLLDVKTTDKNITWQFQSDADWARPRAVNSITKGNNSIIIDISANSGVKRIANISVNGTGEYSSLGKKTYVLTQTGTSVPSDGGTGGETGGGTGGETGGGTGGSGGGTGGGGGNEEKPPVETPSLTVSPLFLSLNDVGGSTTISVSNSSNGTLNWNVVSNQSWLKVSPSSGTNNQSITVTYTPNSTGQTRTATITVTSNNGNGSPKVISVTQPSNCIEYTATAILSAFSFDYVDCNGQTKSATTSTTMTFLAKVDSPKRKLGNGFFFPAVAGDDNSSSGNTGGTSGGTGGSGGGATGGSGGTNPSDDTNPNGGGGFNDDIIGVSGNEQSGSFGN